MLLLIGLALADVPTKIPPDKERGESLYREYCWQCHGAQALGDGPLAAALPSPALAGRVKQDAFPETIDLIQAGAGDMPAFSQVIDRHDTRRILLWLESLNQQTGLAPGEKPEEAPVEPAEEDEGKEEEEAGSAVPERKARPVLRTPVRPPEPPAEEDGNESP